MALRSSDLLADFVVDEVPPTVRGTMNEEQIKAVRSAAGKRHAVDLRFVLPLAFTQLYFVLLIGKDTRRETIEVHRERRERAGLHLSSFAIGVLAAIAVVVVAVLLYVAKSRAGVDLFSGHASDLVPK